MGRLFFECWGLSVTDMTVMDTVMETVVVAAVIIILVVVFVRGAISSRKFNNQRKALFEQGTRFDAEIVGVAKPGTVLAINGVQPQANALGMHNTTAQRQDERAGRARVKVRFVHPHTRVVEFQHVSLYAHDFSSNRITRVALPGTIKLGKGTGTMAIIQHNKRLYEEYVRSLDSRNLTPEKKKELIRKAQAAMSFEDKKYDAEGYRVLEPPVKAEGFLLDGMYVFRQVGDDTEFLRDWTKDLE